MIVHIPNMGGTLDLVPNQSKDGKQVHLQRHLFSNLKSSL